MSKSWKWIKRIIIAILILIPILIITPFIGFPIANNIKATILANEMKKSTPPVKTEIIEVVSGCGNTGGTGNHTEILICLLIKSDLPQEKITELYKGIYSYIDVVKVKKEETSTFSMQTVGLEFEKLKGIKEYNRYYIVERIEDAVSSEFDLRGH